MWRNSCGIVPCEVELMCRVRCMCFSPANSSSFRSQHQFEGDSADLTRAVPSSDKVS